MIYRVFAGLFAVLILAACNSQRSEETAESVLDLSAQTSAPTTALPVDEFSEFPEVARQATRLGDPRPPAYWALWNTCAADNRAETAAANGGRAAGWFLVDDILADPGLQLGDQPLASCGAALAVREGAAGHGDDASPSIASLAGQLLAAELNLNVGAETCSIAEEAVVGAHLVLSEVGYAGEELVEISPEVSSAVSRLLPLLEGYNSGQLCR